MLARQYRLQDGFPSIDDYLAIRRLSGLSPKTKEQAEAARPGTWAAVHAIHIESGNVVAMGRVIGDGGWYFHIVDMATLPQHQRNGIGDAILRSLIERILEVAEPNPYVTLMADEPGRPLYGKHGFFDSSPETVGMVLRLPYHPK